MVLENIVAKCLAGVGYTGTYHGNVGRRLNVFLNDGLQHRFCHHTSTDKGNLVKDLMVVCSIVGRIAVECGKGQPGHSMGCEGDDPGGCRHSTRGKEPLLSSKQGGIK